MTKTLLLLLFTGHVLGDFYFQSAELAANKDKAFVSLFKHSAIYLIAMILAIMPVLSTEMVIWVILISLHHLLTDLVKHVMKRKRVINNKEEATAFLLDQTLHALMIIAAVMAIHLFDQPISYANWIEKILEKFQFDAVNALSWILALLVIAKPVCVTIKKVLYNYQPDRDEIDSGYPNAGATIGILERIIIMLMLIANQYAAIGFVLTAKSIARYNKIAEDPKFSEYYLLGTLLSVMLAVITHLVVF